MSANPLCAVQGMRTLSLCQALLPIVLLQRSCILLIYCSAFIHTNWWQSRKKCTLQSLRHSCVASWTRGAVVGCSCCFGESHVHPSECWIMACVSSSSHVCHSGREAMWQLHRCRQLLTGEIFSGNIFLGCETLRSWIPRILFKLANCDNWPILLASTGSAAEHRFEIFFYIFLEFIAQKPAMNNNNWNNFNHFLFLFVLFPSKYFCVFVHSSTIGAAICDEHLELIGCTTKVSEIIVQFQLTSCVKWEQ